MTTKTLLKLAALAGLLTFALDARASKFSDLQIFPSSGAYFIGYPEGAGTDLTPAKANDAVLTSSGAAVVQSTSATAAHRPFRVKNAAGTDILGVRQDGTTVGTFSGSVTGNADTATALAANGANCSAGQYPLGVDASGAVESCTAAGVGDAVKTSTQTWSGGNTLYGSTTFYGMVQFGSGGGSYIQVISSMSAGYHTGTTDMVYDDTIPQITEGDQVITSTITPQFSNSLIEAEFRGNCGETSNASVSKVIMAMFRDSTADAIAAELSGHALADESSMDVGTFLLRTYVTAGSTAPTVFSVRGGLAGTGAGATFACNGTAGARKLGGVQKISLTLREIKQ